MIQFQAIPADWRKLLCHCNDILTDQDNPLWLQEICFRFLHGLFLCLCGASPAPLLCLLLSLKPGGISFNIQNPIPHKSKKTKGFLEISRAKECQRGIAGAEESTKRAAEYRLKASTHIWDRIPRHSNPTRRTKHCQTERKSIKHQQKAADYLYPFSPFLAIPNAETSRRRPLHRNIFHDKLLAFCMTGK